MAGYAALCGGMGEADVTGFAVGCDESWTGACMQICSGALALMSEVTDITVRSRIQPRQLDTGAACAFFCSQCPKRPAYRAKQVQMTALPGLEKGPEACFRGKRPRELAKRLRYHAMYRLI